MWKVYRITDEAWEKQLSWDEVFAAGEIEVVEEYDTKEEAIEACDNYDPCCDRYGVTCCDI